jgi:hypothetical protein
MDDSTDFDAEAYFRRHKNFGNATAGYNDKNIAKLVESYQGDELTKTAVPYEQAVAAGVLLWKMRRHAKDCNGC